MAAQLLTSLFLTALDGNGRPISGAKLYFYVTGTTTPASAYTTSALSVAHPSPLVADAAGRFAAVYLDATVSYRAKLFDATDVIVRDIDPLNESVLGQLAASGGAGLVGSLIPDSGGVAETIARLISKSALLVTSFGAVGDGATDDTPAFTAAAATGKTILIPPTSNYYKLTNEVTLANGTSFIGLGMPLVKQATSGKRAFVGTNVNRVTFRDFRLQGVGAATLFTTGQRVDPDGVASRTVTDDGLIHITATTAGASSDIRVTGMEGSDAYNILAIRNAYRVWVEDNYFHDWMLYGMLGSGTCSQWIKRNKFKGCAQTGGYTAYAFSATGNSAGGFPQNGLWFEDNDIEGVPSWDGFMTHECTGLHVKNNRMIDVRNGVDVTSPTQLLKDIHVIGNDVTHTVTDTWKLAGVPQPAAHFSIGVAADAGAPVADGAEVRENISRGANSVTGLKSGGNAIGSFIFSRIKNLTCENNQILDIGDADAALGTPAGYVGISVYNPQGNIRIDKNRAKGALSSHLVKVFQSSGGASSDVNSICDNQIITSGALQYAIRFDTGAFTKTKCRGNQTTASGTSFDYPQVSGTTPSVTYTPGEGPIFQASGVYDAPSLVDGQGQTGSITATGAAKGDIVLGLSASDDIQGILQNPYVNAASSLAFRYQNETGGTIDLASMTLTALLQKTAQ